MDFILAFKAFFKALKDHTAAKEFVEAKPSEMSGGEDHSHLRLLNILQQDGRLIDFFKEDISHFTDAQIGAAVRKMQGDCSKTLEEFIVLRPLCQEEEGARMTVHPGFDRNTIKLMGNVKGSPPYQGIVRHRGWKAHKLSLPKQVGASDPSVVFPAEVEIP